MIQNKFHFAIAGQTAVEIIYAKANRNTENMRLTIGKKTPDSRI
jgi:hypothetical protein